jgi:hypothetical protein
MHMAKKERYLAAIDDVMWVGEGTGHVCVRNVISGSETDPIRALIGDVCRVWQWTPSHAAPQ